MFIAALNSLGIAPEDYGRTIMVGNHLSRDVRGANRVGMISVWLDWAPRREKVPADAAERPDYTIHQPIELLALVERLEERSGQPSP
jgi:putative hydrolase of the HAD superfamily